MPVTTSKGKGKAKKVIPAGTKPLYPEEASEIRSVKRGNPITVEDAKTMLGWKEVENQADSLGIADPNGKYFITERNTKNRPIYRSHVELLTQEHLNRRWRLNGEPIVIGNYGEVLSGQHRLISLVFAEMERQKKALNWAHFWSAPVTMDTNLVVGVDEQDDVINTLDTGKPRTFPDVVFRSPYYAKEKIGRRKELSKMTEFALSVLWSRTRVRSHSRWVQERSHAESIDFLQRHTTLWETCTQYILKLVEEFPEGLSGKIGAGTAAGLLYLMGASATKTNPGTKEKDYNDATGYFGMYLSEGNPSEKMVDFANMEKAKDFWRRFVSGEEAIAGPIIQAAAEVVEEGRKTTKDEWIAIIIYAWNKFLATGKVKLSTISIKDVMKRAKKTGKLYLPGDQHPKIGGIDLGEESNDIKPAKPKKAKKAKAGAPVEGEEGEVMEDETEEEEVTEDEDESTDEEEEEEEDEDEETEDDWGSPVEKEEDEEDDEEEEEEEEEDEEPTDTLEKGVPALSAKEIEKRGVAIRDEKAAKKTGAKTIPSKPSGPLAAAVKDAQANGASEAFVADKPKGKGKPIVRKP